MSDCGMCQTPSCLQCFPFERKRMPLISSMADVSMGEERYTDKLDAAVKLTAQRKKNIAEGIEAPTVRPDTLGEALGRAGFPVEGEPKEVVEVDNPVEVLNEIFGEEKVLDFTGDVDGGGIKMSMYADFREKPPLSLVPRALLYACGRALGFGANKYAANNWRRGMAWSSPLSGLLRHIVAWSEGEDNDTESGLSHLDHAAACLAFLTHMETDDRYKHLDDRP